MEMDQVHWMRKYNGSWTTFGANVFSAKGHKGPRHLSCVAEINIEIVQLIKIQSGASLELLRQSLGLVRHVTLPCSSDLAKCATQGRHGSSNHLESTGHQSPRTLRSNISLERRTHQPYNVKVPRKIFIQKGVCGFSDRSWIGA